MPDKAPSPLRNAVFRALWAATLVSNIGTWMQAVGAQWLLVNSAHAAILVSLVQTADMLPDLMFAYAGGVMADILDRRKILIYVQAFLAAAGLVLTVLTYAGQMHPALLLAFTFLIGSGSAFYVPAYQAMIPDLVPRQQIPAASSLASINVNLARAIGPAIAGIVIQHAGVGACFALNAASFLYFGIVAVFAKVPQRKRTRSPERFIAALHAGGRYVRHSPVVMRMLARAAVFLVPASVLWALLPLVSTQILGLQVSGYGVLLAALGGGAIAGAALNRRMRELLSPNKLLAMSSIVYAAALVAVVLVPSPVLAFLVLIPTGLVWVVVLSMINSEIQLFLPAWVRARGLSIYQMVFFGSLGGGSALWGFVAAGIGVAPSFYIAAGLLALSGLSVKIWPLHDIQGMDRNLVVYWPEPNLVIEPQPQDGPIMVQTTYTIASENMDEFMKEMRWLERTRLRTGAVEWALYRVGEREQRFVETFVVTSWEEHVRQHEERGVGADKEHDDRAKALSEPPVEIVHYIGIDV
jgi:predicted MFS family arabinose efflux permease